MFEIFAKKAMKTVLVSNNKTSSCAVVTKNMESFSFYFCDKN